MAKNFICSVVNCGKPARTMGWCRMHYMRWHKHGDVETVLIEKGKNLRWLNEVALMHSGNECLTWPFDRNVKGYGRITIKNRRHAAHRVVCERVHGLPPSPEYDAAHSCGNGHLGCVTPAHIRWLSRRENILEKNVHGTMARGSRHGNATMNEETALSVKSLLGSMTQQKIAERLGVTRSAVRDIKIGKTWGWL